MKKIKRLVFLIILIPVLYFVTVILLGTFTNYSPDLKENISSIEEGFPIDDSINYTALIWNVGYAGLGAEMDFFYDGGKRVRDSKENVERNLAEIGALLEQNDWIDFILLQEVDYKSKRSYKGNQVEYFNSKLSSHFSFASLNYKVKFVPVPIFKPLGTVKSGLVSYSSTIPSETVRYSFPGNYSWPMGVFMLDRCFMTMRFPVKNGRELLVVNTHNSAYDDGSLREQQLDYMKNFLLKEEAKGNYLLVGGDWNQCPPNFENNFSGHLFDSVDVKYIEEGYPEKDWNFNYDSTIPSNRRIQIPYERGVCQVTLIDYFLTSPNIEVLKTENIDLGFKNSDHQPVLITFRLK